MTTKISKVPGYTSRDVTLNEECLYENSIMINLRIPDKDWALMQEAYGKAAVENNVMRINSFLFTREEFEEMCRLGKQWFGIKD